MIKYNIGNNIYFLRKYYNETQADLAFSIGLDSPNTITNYELGDRFPKPEILEKIALHFRISTDELLYSDYSGMGSGASAFQRLAELPNATLEFMPVFSSEKAMQNADFQKGYAIHQRFIQSMETGPGLTEKDLNECIHAYTHAAEEGNVMDAIANLLWLTVIIETASGNQWGLHFIDAFKNNREDICSAIREHFLRDTEVEEDAPLFTKDDQHKLEENVFELIRLLKATPDWADLADYYIALLYILNGISNGLSADLNLTIGRELLVVLHRTGNHYARHLLLYFEDKA